VSVEVLPWIAVGFAALAYVVREGLDLMGWSRSSKMLRQENEDLMRRDTERELTIQHLRGEVARMEGELTSLRAQVAELSKRDQAAVIRQLEDHERRADERSDRSLLLLTEIRDELRGRSAPTTRT
jgi:TolA-binding protein